MREACRRGASSSAVRGDTKRDRIVKVDAGEMSMNTPSISQTAEEIPLNALPPLSLDKFLHDTGISPVTAWRYRQRGWLRTVNICGRHYVPREAIVEFNSRAAKGEFSKAPTRPVRKAKND